jgi:hypothetical protein
MRLQEEVTEGCLDVDNDAPVVLQLTDNETVRMAIRPSKDKSANNSFHLTGALV